MAVSNTEPDYQQRSRGKWDQRPWWVPYAHAVVIFLILLGFGCLVFTPGCRIGYKARVAEAKQNLIAIHLAIERYAMDFHQYPENLSPLLSGGYLSHWPDNPFSGRVFEKMRQILPGDSATPGDFVYLPESFTSDKPRRVTGYGLYLYGEKVVPPRRRLEDPPPGIDAKYIIKAIHQLAPGAWAETERP